MQFMILIPFIVAASSTQLVILLMAFVVWTFRASFMEGEKKKEPDDENDDNDDDDGEDEEDQSRCCGSYFQGRNNELGGFPNDE
jgi:hypothetical protein